MRLRLTNSELSERTFDGFEKFPLRLAIFNIVRHNPNASQELISKCLIFAEIYVMGLAGTLLFLVGGGDGWLAKFIESKVSAWQDNNDDIQLHQ
jgi:hypothetical protein